MIHTEIRFKNVMTLSLCALMFFGVAFFANASDKYGGSTSGSSDGSSGDSGYTTRDVLGQTTINGTTYDVVQRSDTIGPSLEEQYSGSDGDGGSTYTAPSCSGNPNVVPEDIYFEKLYEPGVNVNEQDMDLGETYIPKLDIKNRNCMRTTDSRYHRDNAPFGADGTFPVRLRIDFNKDGTYEYAKYNNSVGPLAGYQQITISFPPVTMTELGTHTYTATVDIKDSQDSGRGCAGDWGCIAERGNPASNDRTETFIVTKPEIQLGSYVKGETSSFFGTEPLDIRLGNREINVGEDIGIYWQGTKVAYDSCVGISSTLAGNPLNDFSGKREGINLRTSLKLPTRYYDANITEPTLSNAHVYTITCDTSGGGTVSDTIVINNGADVSELVFLRPAIDNLTVMLGSTVDTIPFTVENYGSDVASGYRYVVSIDGTQEGSGLLSSPLGVGAFADIRSSINWTAPNTPQTLSSEVCISHPDMLRDACDSGLIRVVEAVTECNDGVDNDGDATIDEDDTSCWDNPLDSTTYDPNNTSESVEAPVINSSVIMVRSGDSVTIDWDPLSNTACSLSDNLSGDPSQKDSEIIVVNTPSTFTIDCEGGSASVIVKVLSSVGEI